MARVDRREFLKVAGAGLVAGPLLGCQHEPAPAVAPKVAAQPATPATPPPAGRLPIIFVSHGSPMNAVQDNPYTRFLDGWAAKLPRPKAILCVSAHFEDFSPVVTVSEKPETIYDYYNFPEYMYELQYPAPGSPALAERAATLLEAGGLIPVRDGERGLDHGCWAPLVHLYPKADIPVVQVSLWFDEPHRENFKLGRALAPLRDEGVLLYCSGGVTHNLRGTTYVDPTTQKPVADWANRFDRFVCDRLERWDLDALADFETASPYGRHAHPTTEHFEPLLVACGAADATGQPKVEHVFEHFQGRAFSMRCFTLT